MKRGHKPVRRKRLTRSLTTLECVQYTMDRVRGLLIGPKRISQRDQAVAEALIWRLMPLVRHAVQREMRGEKHEIEIIQ